MFSTGRVLWSWFGAYLLALLAVILQPTTPAQYLGRYSTTSFMILLVLLAGLLPAYLVIRWLTRHVPSWTLSVPLNLLSLLLIGVALAGGWWVNTGPTASYLLIRLLLTYVLLSAAVWHLLQLPDRRGAAWLLPGLVIVALIAVYLLARDVPGLLWTDEGFMASAARGVVETGRPQVTFLQPAIREAISSMYAGLAGWYALTGASFSSGRLFILTAGVSSLVIVSLALRRVYHSGVVWLTALAGVISLLNVNYLRQDAGVAVWLSLALLAYIIAEAPRQRKRLWWHALAGLCLGLSLDGHPVAYRLCVGFGLAYLIEAVLLWRRDRQVDRRVPALLAGGLAAVGVYYLVYATWLTTFTQYTDSSPFVVTGWRGFALLGQHLFDMLQRVPLVLGGALFGCVLMALRRSALDRLLLTVILSSVLILSFLYSPLRMHYVYHMLPLLWMALAGGLSVVVQSLPDAKQHTVLPGLALLISLAGTGLILQQVRQESRQSYDPVLDIAHDARAYITDEDVLVSVDPTFFAFYDHPAFYEITAGHFNSRQTGIREAAYWDVLAPTAVLIVDGYPLPYPSALRDYMATRDFQRVQCWSHRVTGRVELHVLNADLSTKPCENLHDRP